MIEVEETAREKAIKSLVGFIGLGGRAGADWIIAEDALDAFLDDLDVESMAAAMRVHANIGPVDPWEVAPAWVRARWVEIATAGLSGLWATTPSSGRDAATHRPR